MSVSEGITITQSDKIWNGSAVTIYEGSMQALRKHIPIYERRTFGPEFIPLSHHPDNELFETPSYLSGINHFHDVIVRLPLNEYETEIPVGIVSKQYALVQHRNLFDEAHSTTLLHFTVRTEGAMYELVYNTREQSWTLDGIEIK